MTEVSGYNPSISPLPPTGASSSGQSEDLITRRLTSLLATADRATHALTGRIAEHTAPDADLIRLLVPQLENEVNQDIRSRLADIAAKEFASLPEQQRQLQDMQLYLSYLNRHASGELTPLVQRVKQASAQLAEAIIPTWKSDTEMLDLHLKAALGQPRGESHSVLETHRGVSIDPKTFAHIHAEEAISGSPLEGHSSLAILRYLLHYLDSPSVQAKPWYAEVRKMIQDAHDVLQQTGEGGMSLGGWDASRAFTPRHHRFHNHLQQLVENLKPGEKTLVDAGWKGAHSGHSMKMGIERQANGLLTVTLYNTGHGLDKYHPNIIENGRTYYQPFKRVLDVPESTLLNPRFTQAYLEIYSVIEFDDKSTHYGPDDLYNLILNGLGGRIDECSDQLDLYMLPQNSGTCAWSSLVAVFHTELKREDYYDFITGVQLDSLSSFYQASKEELDSLSKPKEQPAPTEEEELDFWNLEPKAKPITPATKQLLLQRAVQTLAHTATEAARLGALSGEQLLTLRDTLLEANQALERTERLTAQRRPEQITIDSSWRGSDEPLLVDLPRITQPSTSSASSSSQAIIPAPMPSYPLAWAHEPEQLVQGLRDLHQHVRSCQKSKRETDGIRQLEAFFELQANPDLERVWDSLPPDHVEAAIVELANLSELLLDATVALPNNRNTYTAYAFYVSALLSKLVRRLPAELGLQECTLPYGYKLMVIPSFGWGILNQDRNLYSIPARLLRSRAFEILQQQPTHHSMFLTPIFKNPNSSAATTELPAPGNPETPPIYKQWDTEYIRKRLETDEKLMPALQDFGKCSIAPKQTEAIAIGLCDLNGAVLPKTFCAIRRHVAITECLSCDRVLRSDDTGTFHLQTVEEGHKTYVVNRKPPTDKEKTQRDFMKPDTFNKLTSDRLNHQRRKFPEPSRYDTEADIMVRPDGESKQFQLLTVYGELNGGVNPWHNQALKTLSYYLEHLELLKDHDARMLFRFLLFEGDHLEKILSESPETPAILADVVRKGLEVFKVRGDIAATAFFIEIGRTLQALVKAKGLTDPFPDFRSEITNLLRSSKALSSVEKTLLYRQLAASYATNPPETLSSQDAANILTATLYSRANSTPEQKITDQCQEEMSAVFQGCLHSLSHLLMGSSGPTICQFVLNSLSPDASQQQWNCGYPFSTSADGRYVIDAATPQLLIDGKAVTGLPPSLFDNTMKAVFRRKTYDDTVAVGPNCYQFTDERGNLTEIRRATSVWHPNIMQRIDGGWYQWTHSRELWPYDLPETAKPPEAFRKLCNQSSLWLIVDKNQPPHVDIKDNNLQTTHRIWLTPRQEGGFAVYLIVKLMPNGEEWTLCNTSSLPAEHPLKAICGDAIVWEDQSGIRGLEVTNLDLNFNVRTTDDTLVAECVEYPGYVLAANQQYQGLQTNTTAVVLENPKEGKRKLIIPNGTIIVEEKGSLNQHFTIRFDDQSIQRRSIDLDLDSDLRPTPTHPESQLYLASLLLAEKKYAAAQALIRASHSNILPYTPRSIELLLSLLKIASASNDRSPQAVAVLMTVLAQIPTQQVIDMLPDEQQKKRDFIAAFTFVAERYPSYRQQIGTVPGLAPPEHEENAAITTLLEALVAWRAHQTTSIDQCLSGLIHSLLTQDSVRVPFIPELSTTETTSKGRNLFLSLFLSDLQKEKRPLSYFLSSPDAQPPTRLSLLTRPLYSLQDAFQDLYALALNPEKHAELNIILTAPHGKEGLSVELITLLKSVMHAIMTGTSGPFPPSLEALNQMLPEPLPNISPSKRRALIAEGKIRDPKTFQQSFQDLLNWAKDYEAKHLQAAETPSQTASSSSSTTTATIPPVVLAKDLATRETTSEPFVLRPIPNRHPILTPQQLTNTFSPIPNGGVRLTVNERTALQEAVRGNSDTKEAEELCQHIENYWSQPKHDANWHRIHPDNVAKTKGILNASYAEQGKLVRTKEQQLLQMANQLPLEMRQALTMEIEKVGEQRRHVTIKDLTLFAARSRHFTTTNKNPQLIAKERELLQMTLEYLDAKAHQQQLGRALTAVKKLEETNHVADPATYNRLSEACYIEITRERPYDPHQLPELLVFEAVGNIGLYDWQVRDLDRMLRTQEGDNPNLILEKVMGSGKSKVYLPILALSKADGDHLSVVVVHSSQYDTVGREMEINSGDTFAQAAHTLHFTRESDSSEAALRKILEQCQAVRKNRNFLVVTDKTLHNLSLAFDLMWDDYLRGKQTDKALEKRIEVMREILNLFKTKGRATLDEADLLLNVRFETVYAIGEKQALNSDHCNIVADLFEAVEPHISILTPYTNAGYLELRPTLIQSFLDQVAAKWTPQIDRDKIINYMDNGQEGNAYVATLPRQMQHQLAIARYHFKDLLPLVLSRRCGEHYGYSDRPGQNLPVPYVSSGVPSPSAEFGFPYALLDYAVLTLEKEGPSPTLLAKIFTNLQQQARKEQTINPRLPLTETKAYREFRDIVGHDADVPFFNTPASTIQEVADKLKQHHPNKYAFAKKYLFPDVTIHPRKLTSTPYTLVNMMAETQGFTGTPYNSDTYPRQLQTLRDPQSAGKTLGIIWQNSKVVRQVSDTGTITVDDLVSRIPLAPYHAYIDVKATFNDMPNQSVAEAMLRALPPHIHGVVFFQGNTKMFLERGRTAPKPFDQCSIKKEHLFVYYDQYHTTGTDIPIGGRSLISLGKNNKIRDLEQGYMRDRQAETGERVDLLVGDEDAHCFRTMLQLPADTPVDPGMIIRCLEINQEAEIADQLLMGAFAAIRETVDRHLRRLRLDPSIPPEELHKHAEAILELIGESVLDDPYGQFGTAQELVSKADFVQGLIDAAIVRAQPLFELSGGTLSEPLLRYELTTCFRFYLLPDTILSPVGGTPDQLVEKQSQAQQQQQRMAMVSKNVQSDVASGDRYGPIHWNWDPKRDTFSHDFYHLAHPSAVREMRQPVLEKLESYSLLAPVAYDQAPIMRLSDVLAEDPDFAPYADCFDIEVSYNFVKTRGEVQHILFRENRKSGEVIATIVSETDKAFFFDKLAEERKSSQPHDYDVTLYNSTLQTIQHNGASALEREKMHRHLVQAKFYNGESLYSAEEYPILLQWIQEKGTQHMLDLFVHHILPRRKPERATQFHGSVLEDLLMGLQPSSSDSSSTLPPISSI